MQAQKNTKRIEEIRHSYTAIVTNA